MVRCDIKSKYLCHVVGCSRLYRAWKVLKFKRNTRPDLCTSNVMLFLFIYIYDRRYGKWFDICTSQDNFAGEFETHTGSRIICEENIRTIIVQKTDRSERDIMFSVFSVYFGICMSRMRRQRHPFQPYITAQWVNGAPDIWRFTDISKAIWWYGLW